MKTKFNKKTNKTEWLIDRWWEKTFYAVGMIYSAFFVIGFVAGFFMALGE